MWIQRSLFPGRCPYIYLKKIKKIPWITPFSLEEAVSLTKAHLGLSRLRLAEGRGSSLATPVRTIAVCAGSGASVIGTHPVFTCFTSVRQERGGPFWLLKLRQMETRGVHMSPSLVGSFGGRAGTRGFRPVLAAQVGPVHRLLFHFIGQTVAPRCLSVNMCLCFI